MSIDKGFRARYNIIKYSWTDNEYKKKSHYSVFTAT